MTASTSRLLALASTLLFAAIPSTPAHAVAARNLSAGAACHPANGAAAAKFTYTNHTIQNIGTTDQYVICNLPMAEDLLSEPVDPQFLAVSMTAGATGGTVVCVAQIGYHSGGSTTIRSTHARSVTLAAFLNSALSWNEGTAWNRAALFETLTLNCKLPPTVRLGLIEWHQ